MRPTTCIVLCRDDRTPEQSEDEKAPYMLATRTVFESPEAATLYCKAILHREPLIIRLDPDELREGEERGTLAYWQRLMCVQGAPGGRESVSRPRG